MGALAAKTATSEPKGLELQAETPKTSEYGFIYHS
jgi:hypothetical protein